MPPEKPAENTRNIMLARLMPTAIMLAAMCIASYGSQLWGATAPEKLLAEGKVDEAIEVLAAQIQNSPTAETYNLLCRAEFELDNWDAGIADCEKAVALAPDNGIDHLWLGRIYGEKADKTSFLKAAGLARKVHAEFQRSVELLPDSWQARTDFAEFELEAPGMVGGNEDKARAQAEALLALNPGMAHWVLARIAQKHKNNDAAEQEYRLAIEASHGGVSAWVSLAGFYRHLNRLDDMEQALMQMESRPVDRPGALMDAANLLLRSGRGYPLATRLTRKYLSASTDEEQPAFKAHYVLGELLEKQGDRESAEKEFRISLSMAHDFKRAQEGLKRVER
jgi:tetratricopeptide (TPR) repeat protein